MTDQENAASSTNGCSSDLQAGQTESGLYGVATLNHQAISARGSWRKGRGKLWPLWAMAPPHPLPQRGYTSMGVLVVAKLCSWTGALCPPPPTPGVQQLNLLLQVIIWTISRACLDVRHVTCQLYLMLLILLAWHFGPRCLQQQAQSALMLCPYTHPSSDSPFPEASELQSQQPSATMMDQSSVKVSYEGIISGKKTL